MATAAERLAREISELRRRLEGLERSAAADLRSIDDGTLSAFDEDGNEVVEVGRREDGSYGVQGKNGGKVRADEYVPGSVTADAILDGSVGKDKVDFYADVEAAKEAADDAAAKADKAEQDALDALDAADGSAKIVYDTEEPEGSESTYWIDTDTGRGHRWDGDSWVEIQDSDVQSALSEANDARSEAQAAQDAADSAQSRADDAYELADGKIRTFFGTDDPTDSETVDEGDLWLDESDDSLKRWDGSDWRTVKDPETQDALQQAADAQAAADGKITTFVGSSEPEAEGEGDFWVDTSQGNLLHRYEDDVWVPLRVGGSAIEDEAIDETKIEDDSISSPKMKANSVTAEKLEAVLVLVNRIVAGNPDGARSEVNADGFESWNDEGERTFYADEEGNVFLSGAIESRNYSEAESGWRLDDEVAQVENLNVLNDLGAERVTATEIELDGEPLGDSLDERSEGLVRGGKIDGSTNSNPNSNAQIVARLNDVELKEGRVYLLHYNVTFGSPADANDILRTTIRYTTDGSNVTTNSSQLTSAGHRIHVNQREGNMPTISHTSVFESASDQTWNFGIQTAVVAGGGAAEVVVTQAYRPQLWVVDLGPSLNRWTSLQQVNKASGGDDSNPTKEYTKTWNATWGDSWGGDGSKKNTNDLYQGYYSGTWGNQKSAFGFDDSNIRSNLSGATIKKVQLTFRVKHSYYGSGMTVRVKGHNVSGEPANFPSQTGTYQTFTGRKAGSTYTVTLPNSWGESFRDGNAKGLTFGPGDGTDRTFYGYMYGAGSGSAPKLKITYEK